MNLREKFTRNTRRKMRKLGTYKPEFEDGIRFYVDALVQYDSIWKEYEESGFLSVIECPGGFKKNPLLGALEDTRKQISLWSDKLGLNPKSLDNMKAAQAQENQSGLAQTMKEITLKLGQ